MLEPIANALRVGCRRKHGAAGPRTPAQGGTARPAARRTIARRAGTLLAVSLSLTLATTGCTRYDTTSPSAARAAADKDHPAKLGPVGCRKAKCIALTFDAGPSADSPRLLDILKKEHVHATFFLLGKKHIARYPELVKRMAAEDHEVASHTWDHRILTEIKPDEVRAELTRPDEAIEKLIGHKPTLKRPPQGRTDKTVNDICRQLGLAEVLWSVTAKDYQTTDSTPIRRRVLDQAGRDGIILLHDIYKGTVPAVPGIIDALKARGYVFVTVPQLLTPGTAKPGTVYKP